MLRTLCLIFLSDCGTQNIIHPVLVFRAKHARGIHCVVCTYPPALVEPWEEMATHSSVLAWRIPGMAEPDGLPSMELHRVRHD